MVNLLEELKSKVLLCDGAMGSYSRSLLAAAGKYTDGAFMGYPGLTDALTITHPEIISQVHREYLEAGADIITTNTSNSMRLNLERNYRGLEQETLTLNAIAATLAREAIDNFPDKNQVLFVLGGMSSGNFQRNKFDLGSPYDLLLGPYTEQAQTLIENGVDGCIIETCTDIEQAEAAVDGVRQACKNTRKEVPIFVSVTLAEAGKTWTGQSIGDFAQALSNRKVDALGVNCMLPETVGLPLEWLFKNWDGLILCQPNGYEDPVQISKTRKIKETNSRIYTGSKTKDSLEVFVQTQKSSVVKHGLNIIGGCCGTTPGYIRALDAMLKGIKPGQRCPPPLQRSKAGLPLRP